MMIYKTKAGNDEIAQQYGKYGEKHKE